LRKPGSEGARELVIRSYFPDEIIKREPEVLASNLFRVVRLWRAADGTAYWKEVDMALNPRDSLNHLQFE
jgi:hypothetical protein